MQPTRATIDQLRNEIKQREDQLDDLERWELQEELTDDARGVKCVSVFRRGMSRQLGKNKNSTGAVEQALCVEFDVDDVRVNVNMRHLTYDDNTGVYLRTHDNPRLEVVGDCGWLYQPQTHDADMKKFERDCVNEFGTYSTTVKKCMDLLFDKRAILGFV